MREDLTRPEVSEASQRLSTPSKWLTEAHHTLDFSHLWYASVKATYSTLCRIW